MEAKQLIPAHSPKRTPGSSDGGVLYVSEFFFDTIQGEGIHLGHPSAFLRLQHCTLDCIWCDTNEVWRQGNPYSFAELYNLMATSELKDKLKAGQHLILTGGSPLLQQSKLIKFIHAFIDHAGFKPYIEIENECVLLPDDEIIPLIDCWNNSPKLENSGNSRFNRYDPDIIRDTALLTNSWFKFVITERCDWAEIEEEFLEPGLIRRNQIILMPEGTTREELTAHTEMVVELAIRENVLYRSREHITLWNKMTGI
jgi:organic radical activating enzyme